jgi:hypothetical protein
MRKEVPTRRNHLPIQAKTGGDDCLFALNSWVILSELITNLK